MDKSTFDRATTLNKQINYYKELKEYWSKAYNYKETSLHVFNSIGNTISVPIDNDIISFEELKQLALCNINQKLLELEEEFKNL